MKVYLSLSEPVLSATPAISSILSFELFPTTKSRCGAVFFSSASILSAMHPVSTRVVFFPAAALCALMYLYAPSLPQILFSALLRTEHVLITTRSASSGTDAWFQPAARRSDSSAFDSATFIWQPYVSM